MNADKIKPTEFLPLTPAVFHILLALSDADLHGYAIMKEVEARTSGRILLKPGTLYQAIHRLLSAGLIEEVAGSDAAPENDSRRRVYRLSSLGRQVVTGETQRLQELVRQAQNKNILGKGTMTWRVADDIPH